MIEDTYFFHSFNLYTPPFPGTGGNKKSVTILPLQVKQKTILKPFLAGASLTPDYIRVLETKVIGLI
jgi:hypothetical protein